MTTQQKNNALKTALGRNQKWVVEQLLAGCKVSFASYCNYATHNYNSNKKAFFNLLQRLEEQEIEVELTMGKHGGMWSAYISLAL